MSRERAQVGDDALRLLRSRGAAKVVEADLEPLVRVGVQAVVCTWAIVSFLPGEQGERSALTLVAQRLRAQPFLGGHDLGRRAILIGTANLWTFAKSAVLLERFMRHRLT